MRSFKKILVLSILIVLVTSQLTACGKGETSFEFTRTEGFVSESFGGGPILRLTTNKEIKIQELTETIEEELKKGKEKYTGSEHREFELYIIGPNLSVDIGIYLNGYKNPYNPEMLLHGRAMDNISNTLTSETDEVQKILAELESGLS